MFASVTVIQLKIDEIDEAINIYKECVIPARKSEPGYVAPGGYILVDRETGKAIAITFWADMEEHIAYRASGQDAYFMEQIKKFQDHMVSVLPGGGRYEVCTEG
ncbi:hypothetical protein ACFLVP_01295 [Chloroflexota bacterium]